MNDSNNLLSPTRINRLRIQGFVSQSAAEISSLAFGIRFAYWLCTTVAAYGVAAMNIPVLITLSVIAGFTVVLPNHPFDYIYNYGIRQLLGMPKLPMRSAQIKFACGIAALWMLGVIGLFNAGMIEAGYIFGGLFISVATLVSTTDICIPSMMYNAMVGTKTSPI